MHFSVELLLYVINTPIISEYKHEILKTLANYMHKHGYMNYINEDRENILNNIINNNDMKTLNDMYEFKYITSKITILYKKDMITDELLNFFKNKNVNLYDINKDIEKALLHSIEEKYLEDIIWIYNSNNLTKDYFKNNKHIIKKIAEVNDNNINTWLYNIFGIKILSKDLYY